MKLFSKFWCTPAAFAFFKSAFLALSDKSNSTFTLPSEDYGSAKF